VFRLFIAILCAMILMIGGCSDDTEPTVDAAIDDAGVIVDSELPVEEDSAVEPDAAEMVDAAVEEEDAATE